MFSSERINVRKNKRKESEKSSDNISFSSNNSFYDKLGIEIKRDIIFLIKSGYDKKTIIKLYLLANPSNLNEAVSYLSKENGINQHYFYSSPYKKDCCEICGEEKIMHINEINNSVNLSFSNINSNIGQKNEKINIFKIKTKEERNNKCKICEEEITLKEELNNKCEQCNTYFCSECLYLHIKELIKNGKYSLFCPECKLVYTKDTIEKILLFNIKDKNEVNNLKNLLEKSKTKEIIISNPELMFCPIPNCDGFARKNNNQEYNICTMGHKFCLKCGELWHEDGKCKEEENIDKLFEKYSRKYDLKNCPYCHIITIKNGGCNHMKCHYCGKHWCWICQKIFISTEEHYGNIRSKCYNKMNANFDIIICSKCENEINGNNGSRTFNCEHRICDNCFIEHLLESNIMIFFTEKIIDCPIVGCNGFKLNRGANIIDFILESNNEQLFKRYQFSILLFKYLIAPFFPGEYGKYLNLFGYVMDFVIDLFNCFKKYKTFYSILEIIGIIIGIICVPIYILGFPIFFHLAIRDLYYFKFLPEIRKKFNNKIMFLIILFGEEIFCLVFFFALIGCHFIYTILFFPILFLIIIIRHCIYGTRIC